MCIDNKAIITVLRRLISLLTLHNEDPAAIKRYTQISYFLENTSQEVMELSQAARKQLPGMRESILLFLEELGESGSCQHLEALQAKTLPGALEILRVRGLGPSKVRTLWQVAGITTLAALKEACEHNVLERLEGFGKKTQVVILQNVQELVQYNQYVHYGTALQYVTTFETELQAAFPTLLFSRLE